MSHRKIGALRPVSIIGRNRFPPKSQYNWTDRLLMSLEYHKLNQAQVRNFFGVNNPLMVPTGDNKRPASSSAGNLFTVNNDNSPRKKRKNWGNESYVALTRGFTYQGIRKLTFEEIITNSKSINGKPNKYFLHVKHSMGKRNGLNKKSVGTVPQKQADCLDKLYGKTSQDEGKNIPTLKLSNTIYEPGPSTSQGCGVTMQKTSVYEVQEEEKNLKIKCKPGPSFQKDDEKIEETSVSIIQQEESMPTMQIECEPEPSSQKPDEKIEETCLDDVQREESGSSSDVFNDMCAPGPNPQENKLQIKNTCTKQKIALKTSPGVTEDQPEEQLSISKNPKTMCKPGPSFQKDDTELMKLDKFLKEQQKIANIAKEYMRPNPLAILEHYFQAKRTLKDGMFYTPTSIKRGNISAGNNLSGKHKVGTYNRYFVMKGPKNKHSTHLIF